MADKKEEAKDGKEGEETPKKKSKKKLILILVPVVLLVLGAVGFLLLGAKQEPAEEEGAADEVVSEPTSKKLETLKLDPFIVNLSENISFLKCTILLEFDPVLMDKALGGHAAAGEAHGGGAAGGGGKAEVSGHPHFTERQPMIRDAIIHVLASKKVQDVITTEGKERLKEELIEAINESLGLNENPVVNIYFLDFIIQ